MARVEVYLLLMFVLTFSSCSKYQIHLSGGEGDGENLTENRDENGDSETEFVSVQSLIFELNGIRYQAGSMQGVSDTISLQEEGVRSFGIVDYTPKNAYPVPQVSQINFYRDTYAFSFKGDSIVLMGGEYAKPRNNYLSFIDGSFGDIIGKDIADSPHVQFYNYVNKAEDKTIIENNGTIKEIFWESLGRPRVYRLEISVEQRANGDTITGLFSLPYYEHTNKVKICGVPDFFSGCVELSPGDSLQLDFMVEAPDNFILYEWAKGVANERYPLLNREQVEKLHREEIMDPLLTEVAKRYTDSMVSLTADGMVKVDKNWNMEAATSSGGTICDTVPVCVIFMPQGNPAVDAMERSFYLKEGSEVNVSPAPFFYNGIIKISPKK